MKRNKKKWKYNIRAFQAFTTQTTHYFFYVLSNFLLILLRACFIFETIDTPATIFYTESRIEHV